jgi:ribosomal protein L29
MPRPVLVEQTVQKMKRVNSLRSGIANIKSILKKRKLTDAERMGYEQSKAEKEAELAELEAELGINESL